MLKVWTIDWAYNDPDDIIHFNLPGRACEVGAETKEKAAEIFYRTHPGKNRITRIKRKRLLKEVNY